MRSSKGKDKGKGRILT